MKFCFGRGKFEMTAGHISQYTFMCEAHGMQSEAAGKVKIGGEL